MVLMDYLYNIWVELETDVNRQQSTICATNPTHNSGSGFFLPRAPPEREWSETASITSEVIDVCESPTFGNVGDGVHRFPYFPNLVLA